MQRKYLHRATLAYFLGVNRRFRLPIEPGRLGPEFGLNQTNKAMTVKIVFSLLIVLGFSLRAAGSGYEQGDSNPTGVRLKKISSKYVASGQLISSTFDTGAQSNFTTITWQPTSQNAATSLKFQLASNQDNSTWNFVGPDGTNETFYTISGSNIASVHDSDRFMRYKVFESTTNDKYTPVLTSLNINYVSGCFTPGQVSFGSLTSGNNYSLEVSLSGYQTLLLNSLGIDGNQKIEVLLSP